MSRIQINNLSKNSIQDLKQQYQELDTICGGCDTSSGFNGLSYEFPIGDTITITPSDERLKSDIVHVGCSESGLNIYEFSYKGETTRWRGVMAQEVMESHPEAVLYHPSGYLMVDYQALDVPFVAV